MAQPVGPKKRPRTGSTPPGTIAKNIVDLVPKLLADDRLVLTRIGCALVHGLAHVDPVVEQLVEISFVDQLAALAGNAFGSERVHQHGCRAYLGETFENHPNDGGLAVVHHQLTGVDVVAERNEATHPHALLARGSELVTDALADDLV